MERGKEGVWLGEGGRCGVEEKRGVKQRSSNKVILKRLQWQDAVLR